MESNNKQELDCPGPLPHWADKHLNGEIELYAELATRDGRVTGNGIVIAAHQQDLVDPPRKYYVILTDFGNRITLWEEAVQRQFHLPEFRMKKHLVEFRVGAMQAYMEIERTVKS